VRTASPNANSHPIWDGYVAFRDQYEAAPQTHLRRAEFHTPVATRWRVSEILKEQPMFQSKIRYLAAVATGLLAANAHAGALTQTHDTAPSRTVSFADLDLTTQQGIATLHRRIVSAARQVCPMPDTMNLGQVIRARTCQNEAIERAVRAVGNPMLADQVAGRETFPR
jgi:UrcA family protein